MYKPACFTISLIFMIIIVACSPSQGSNDPEAVMEAYEAAWNAKDLDALMALYVEDAVETNNRGVFSGKEEISEILGAAIEAFSISCNNYSQSLDHVKYDCVNTFYNDGRKKGERYEAVVRNGKIYVTFKLGDFTP